MQTSSRVVLLCHDGAALDTEGLATWLASSHQLVGLVTIQPSPARVWRVARREWRRSGVAGAIDVFALRVFYQLRCAAADARWTREEIARLRARYPAALDDVPRLSVRDPNSPAVRAFLKDRAPDLVVARCKVLLRPDVFTIPRAGTFVLHPGICPEYRNSHGCFWALSRRDLGRVGMTLLKIDAGVDTGPMYLQAGYDFDERRESHIVVQQRVVTENLDRISATLDAVVRGEAEPMSAAGRRSAAWGQPRLSAYLRWRRAARRRTRDAARLASLS